MDISRFTEYRDKVVDNCSRVIVGKDDVIKLVLTSFICSGHVLLEDVPGTGKTMLLRAFAKTIGGDFKRIQFTPDLLPSDLTGINYYNQKSGEFEFRPGPLFTNIVLADEINRATPRTQSSPLFTNIVLADEINRATPRTQSSLLEAMEERQITVDGVTAKLEEPFMVMATQNPIESFGTFPLPDAQLDRFFMRLSLGYMEREQEMAVIARKSTLALVESLERRVTDEDTAFVRSEYVNVKVTDEICGYMMDIIEATRKKGVFSLGVSTRGAMALYKAAQATAALSERDYVIPEDVKYVAPFVLCHRIRSGRSDGSDVDMFKRNVLDNVAVPRENAE